MLAAQCWCDEETKDRVLDPPLVEAIARRIAFLMVDSARFARNQDFYRDLLDKCAENLGPLKTNAFICDDGSVSDSPIRIKIPALVAELTKLAESKPPTSDSCFSDLPTA